MQDAFIRDMFSISDVNNPRYNGHVHVSSLGKGAGGKRDRKGCTKGKIEAIMKNNITRPKVCISNQVKKSVNSNTNHNIFTNHHPVKLEQQEEDPYTFTEPEPQVLSLYQPSGSSNKKTVSPRPSSSNMVCQDKSKFENAGKNVVKIVKGPEGTSKLKKLEADIARSKVIGKRRKVVEQPPNRSNDWPSKREPGKVCISAKRKSTWQRERNSKHELLERIHQEKSNVQQYTRDLYPLGLEVSDSDSDDWEESLPERSWFLKGGCGAGRERRVGETRACLRRQLRHAKRALGQAEFPPKEVVTAVVEAARRFPASTSAILDPALPSPDRLPLNKGAMFLRRGEKCSYPDGCESQALPSTRHCLRHIMYNVDQRLFSHCTAKYPDNTQCTTPVFDVLHHLPLCHRHATSLPPEAQYRSSDSRSSKKVSKKSRMMGSSKRNNKKRKKLGAPPPPPIRVSPEIHHISTPTSTPTPLPEPVPEPILVSEPNVSLLSEVQETIVTESVVEEVPVDEVLAIASALDPEVQQRLLEEHELSTVFNQLSSDALNEILLDKNGEYEPTTEETEALERALEAVNNDVRSLETLSRGLPLLQLPLETMALLDEAAPFPSFHNGFPPPQTHQS